MNNYFPKTFLWGAASSASQYEGGYNVDGKGLTVADVITGGSKNYKRKITYKTKQDNSKHYSDVGGFWGSLTIPKDGIPAVFSDEFYPSHDSTKGYEKIEEDLLNLKELGINCYRMSISWARIFPNGDDEVPNQKGLEFYRNIFVKCQEFGIKPIVTLYHYDLPLALTIKYGGWKNRKLIELYEKYAKTVMSEYIDLVEYWITFNEINSVIVESFKNAGMLSESPQDFAQAAHNELVASARAVRCAHQISSHLKVGCMVAYTLGYAKTCNPEDKLEEYMRSREYNFFLDVQCHGVYPNYKLTEYQRNKICLDTCDQDWLDLKEGCVDYISFSYYSTGVISTNYIDKESKMGPENPFIKNTAWGWGIDPIGLRISLNQLFEHYRKPLLIVENGLGSDDTVDEDGCVHDDYRINYIQSHISEIEKAIVLDGIDVIGYTVWATVDFISLGTGEIKKRYGLIYVDRDDQHKGTFNRIKKDSFYWYQSFLKGVNK